MSEKSSTSERCGLTPKQMDAIEEHALDCLEHFGAEYEMDVPVCQVLALLSKARESMQLRARLERLQD
jgi:hypothetical protein